MYLCVILGCFSSTMHSFITHIMSSFTTYISTVIMYSNMECFTTHNSYTTHIMYSITTHIMYTIRTVIIMYLIPCFNYRTHTWKAESHKTFYVFWSQIFHWFKLANVLECFATLNSSEMDQNCHSEYVYKLLFSNHLD